MENKKCIFSKRMKRIVAILLMVALLPIIPIQNAYADTLSISFSYPVETQNWKISWNSISGAIRYEYTVLDETSGKYLFQRDVASGTSFTVPGSKIITDHKYKVWVGALSPDLEIPSNYQDIKYAIASCKKDRKSTLYGTTYTKYNSTYHEKSDVYQIVCKQCGEFIDYETITTNEKHTFVNGKCTKCSYEQEVKPLSVSVSRKQRTATVGEYISAYASISGGSGSRIYSWKVTCDGVTIKETDMAEDEYGLTATKPGQWRFTLTVKDRSTGETDSDTSSAITVNAATCSHDNKTTTLYDTEYLQKTESVHTVRNYYRITCSNPNCGEVINSYYQDSTEAHSFNASGVCTKCGYTKVTVCNHDSTRAEKIRADAYRQINSGSEHYRIEYYRDVCINPDCSTVVVLEREVVNREPHTIVNGVCVCGFTQPTPTCDHATTREVVKRWLEQYSETKHRLTIEYHVFCTCGQVDYTERTESFLEHQLDANGKCACGYQKPVTTEQPPVCSIYGNAHKLTYTGYEAAHPHYIFKRCNCGYAEYTGTNKTASGAVQDQSVCCICHGHQYGEAYEENGAWCQKCEKCGKVFSSPKPDESDNQSDILTVDLQNLLNKGVRNNNELNAALMAFIQTDDYISHDGGSTTFQTSQSAEKNWDDWRFRVAANLYEEIPASVDPVNRVKDLLLDWALDEDESVLLAIDLIQESIVGKQENDSGALNVLSTLYSAMNEYKDTITLLDPQGQLVKDLTGVDFSTYNDDDIQKILQVFKNRKDDLSAITETLKLGVSEVKYITEQQEKNRIIAELCAEYWHNLQIVEEIEKNGDETVKRACEIIKEKMGEEVEKEMNKAVEVAKGLRPILDVGFSKGMKVFFPNYSKAVGTLKAVANKTEQYTNDLLRTQDKIDASRLVLLYDQLIAGLKPNLSFTSMNDESFFYQLELYYVTMQHRFDALEDYLRSDKKSEFQIKYLEQEKNQFQKAYENLLDAYYNGAYNAFENVQQNN